MGTFFRVRLQGVPTTVEDLISGHAFEFGATGLSEALNYVQPNLTYDPEILPVKTHDIDLFFTSTPPADFFNKVREWSPNIRWEIFEEQEKDWLAEWKKGFEPFQLAGPYWVVPSWRPVPAGAEIPLLIDPGMAFGTGTHATTRMASYFVNKVTSDVKSKNKSFLDVGTGTAILAMIAAKAGLPRVVGIEIDPEARRVARENTIRNDLGQVEIPDTLLEDIEENFDLVVANIIDGVLVQIRDQLIECVKPGGDLFLTGILKQHEDSFMEDFIEQSGMTMHRRLEDDEWVGFWLKDPGQ